MSTGPPEGVVPFFMASKTQEIFGCVCDEDVTADMPFKLIPKEEILQDMKMRAAVSDFSVVKQIVMVSLLEIFVKMKIANTNSLEIKIFKTKPLKRFLSCVARD